MASTSISTIEPRHFGYEGMPLTGKQKEIIGINISLAILSTFAVGARFLARRTINLKLWWDDWTILLALILCYGSIAHAVVGINLGLGIPFAYAHISEFLKGGLIYFCVYIVTLATIKFSVLLMYYRIFKVKPFKTAVYVVGSIVAVWTIVAFFITLFECTPISDFWNIDPMHTPRCINRLALYEATAASNTILDIMILCLPIKMILNLQMSLSKRIQLMLTFLLGTLVCVISIVRLVAVITQNVADPSPTTAQVGDYIWTTTETYVAVISACLPTYRPFVTNTSGFFSRLYSNHSQSTKNSRGSKLSGSHEPKNSIENRSWPRKGISAQENDINTSDQGPLMGYQVAVEGEQENISGVRRVTDGRFERDIEMQRPVREKRGSRGIKVESGWGTQSETN